jgi:hypothetical protein
LDPSKELVLFNKSSLSTWGIRELGVLGAVINTGEGVRYLTAKSKVHVI